MPAPVPSSSTWMALTRVPIDAILAQTSLTPRAPASMSYAPDTAVPPCAEHRITTTPLLLSCRRGRGAVET